LWFQDQTLLQTLLSVRERMEGYEGFTVTVAVVTTGRCVCVCVCVHVPVTALALHVGLAAAAAVQRRAGVHAPAGVALTRPVRANKMEESNPRHRDTHAWA